MNEGGRRVAASAPIARSAMAYVLAGGRGSRLLELTDKRAKPAVYFGGKSRIIDFALSNALNSGIRRIGVATQYKAHSLIRHMQRGWNFFRPERNESFDILPASQRMGDEAWYAGTADAVWQNLDIIEPYGTEYIVVLAGDHVYKMDYEKMLQQHVEQGADVTVGCIEVPRMEASGFGVMHVDATGRITDFIEKPADPPPMPGSPAWRWPAWAFTCSARNSWSSSCAATRTTRSSSRDFGKDIIPYVVRHGRAFAHPFSPLLRALGHGIGGRTGAMSAPWMPIGRPISTSPRWCRRSICMTATGRSGPMARSPRRPSSCTIRTGRRGSAVSSLVSGGCIISGAALNRTLLFTGVHVHSYRAGGELGDPAGSRYRPACAAAQRGGGPWRAHPAGPGGRRGPGGGRAAVPPHRERASA